jgi:hypothetical protein
VKPVEVFFQKINLGNIASHIVNDSANLVNHLQVGLGIQDNLGEARIEHVLMHTGGLSACHQKQYRANKE